MFNSKVFLVIIVLTFAVLAGAVTLQLLEMKEYNLFETIKTTVMGTPAAAPAAPAGKTESASAAAPAADDKGAADAQAPAK